MPNTPLGSVVTTPYPGRIIKMGEQDKKVVKALQERLNKIGCGPIDVDGDFGANTKSAVKLFQGRFTDAHGNPLLVDGAVGPISWSVLFGTASVPSSGKVILPFMKEVLRFATTQVGVREKPLGSNRGPEVDNYIRAVGLDPRGNFAWCVAFTHFCYLTAAQKMGIANPHVKTAGVLDHWAKAGSVRGAVRVTPAMAIADPSLITPGALFIMDFGGGTGHTGIVTAVANGFLTTIEGNTNEGGSRQGIGVFQHTTRKINSISKGFIDYSGMV